MSVVYEGAQGFDHRPSEPARSAEGGGHKQRLLEAILWQQEKDAVATPEDVAHMVHVYKSLTDPSDNTRFLLPTRDIQALDRALFEPFRRKLLSKKLEDVKAAEEEIKTIPLVRDRLKEIMLHAEVRIVLEEAIKQTSRATLEEASVEDAQRAAKAMKDTLKRANDMFAAPSAAAARPGDHGKMLEVLHKLDARARRLLQQLQKQTLAKEADALAKTRQTIDKAVERALELLDEHKDLSASDRVEHKAALLKENKAALREASIELQEQLHLAKAAHMQGLSAAEFIFAHRVNQRLQKAAGPVPCEDYYTEGTYRMLKTVEIVPEIEPPKSDSEHGSASASRSGDGDSDQNEDENENEEDDSDDDASGIKKRGSMAPRKRQSGAPGPRQSMAPGRQSVAPGLRKSVAPDQRKSVAPAQRKSVAPAQSKSLAPGSRKSVAPGSRKSGAPVGPTVLCGREVEVLEVQIFTSRHRWDQSRRLKPRPHPPAQDPSSVAKRRLAEKKMEARAGREERRPVPFGRTIEQEYITERDGETPEGIALEFGVSIVDFIRANSESIEFFMRRSYEDTEPPTEYGWRGTVGAVGADKDGGQFPRVKSKGFPQGVPTLHNRTKLPAGTGPLLIPAKDQAWKPSGRSPIRARSTPPAENDWERYARGVPKYLRADYACSQIEGVAGWLEKRTKHRAVSRSGIQKPPMRTLKTIWGRIESPSEGWVPLMKAGRMMAAVPHPKGEDDDN